MKMALAMLGLTLALCSAQTVPNIKTDLSCPNTPDRRQPYCISTLTAGDLRRVVINAPNAICNDGSPAEMYVRPARAGATEPDGPSANRWVIHLLGGSYFQFRRVCDTLVRDRPMGGYAHDDCLQRPLPYETGTTCY